MTTSPPSGSTTGTTTQLPASGTEKKPARSRSFSLRRSLDGQRMRRKHGQTISHPLPQEPVPSIPAQHVRASTVSALAPHNTTTTCIGEKEERPDIRQDDDTKAPPPLHGGAQAAKPPTRRRSVRDLFRAAVTPRAGKKTSPPGLRNSNDEATSAGLSTTTQPSLDQSLYVPRRQASPLLPPLSPPAAFKPLGAHPPPSRLTTLQEEPRSPAARTLTASELDRILAGAPRFAVANRATDKHVQVVAKYKDFDDDPTEEGRDVVDFEHASFRLATSKSVEGVIESPSLRGINGVEPGTVGLESFLQGQLLEPVAACNDSFNTRLLLRDDPERLGLRAPSMERVIDRLAELGDLRAQQDSDTAVEIGEQRAAEMYADLFAKLLVPPRYTAATEHDPTGLEVQMASLVQVLGHLGLWFDMSRSSERVRLGNRIWDAVGQAPDSEVAIDRDILLLQITLAAELLMRIYACSDSRARCRQLSRKVAWDLVLADRFLRGVSIRAGTVDKSNEHRAPNRSSVFSVLTFVTAREDFEDEVVQPLVVPRDEAAQLDGLLTFARVLDWPHADELEHDIRSRLEPEPKRLSTAQPSTPIFHPREKDGYLGVLIRSDGSQKSLQTGRLSRSHSCASNAGFEAVGSATRSWLAGLVMPGESAADLLMSSLLEQSANNLLQGPSQLGDGFFYRDRSYWSKSCIMGRVLAASKNAHDTMSWISISSTASPTHTDGWVRVHSTPISESSEPRLAMPDLMTGNAAFSTKLNSQNVLESDLVWPTDEPPVLGNTIERYTVSFESSMRDAGCAPLTGVVTFDPPPSSLGLRSLTLSLTYDSTFITSQPCFPRSRAPRSANASPRSADKELPAPPCHPLHISQPYRVLPVTNLLAPRDIQDPLLGELGDCVRSAGVRRDSGAGRGARSPVIASHVSRYDDAVLVLDCRGSPALQVLGRAWCASAGWHAIVGRERRTCMGCCVREAKALDVRVVLRV
ncbi:hypothetical protein K461DRAFT_289400 [Myriangium duriaei CBS 260.36]|uniref:Uncharacterized protein n=1 Tax=Myriangium duriaei CBS 260.36 TaxID=1168546 RepID=A0A9P4MRZ4_9PEZI|nr:hypothetical protein K461DRAFT_289400 [Myriangium duriaei CBS 260.36]